MLDGLQEVNSWLPQWAQKIHSLFPLHLDKKMKGDNYENLYLFWSSVQSGKAMIWEGWI